MKNHPDLLHGYFASNPVVSELESEQELLVILKNHCRYNEVATEELATMNMPSVVDMDMLYLRKWLFFKDGLFQRIASAEEGIVYV